MYSVNGDQRAIIAVDEQRVFRVFVEWWDTSDWDYARVAQWSPLGLVSMTDTLENARALGAVALD